MKRIFAAAVLSCVVYAAAFAQFKTDLQVGLGIGAVEGNFKGDYSVIDWKDTQFDLVLGVYGVWHLNNVFGIGFAVPMSLGGGAGDSDFHFDGVVGIGPAVSLNLGNVVAFETSISLDFLHLGFYDAMVPAALTGSDRERYKETYGGLNFEYSGIGFTYDLVAKLFPKKRVNFYLGYRYTGLPNSGLTDPKYSDALSLGVAASKSDLKAAMHTNRFVIGVCWNF